MIEQYSMPVVAEIVVLMELIGVAITTLGAGWALARFVTGLFADRERSACVQRFRSELGRSIILGLEFLVVADIIHTVVIDLSAQSVLSLLAIVAIRILLSFTLEVEIDGRWPWQRKARQDSQS